MTGVFTFSIKPTILASHVYKSLTREHTTTVDLEMMASSPTSDGYNITNTSHHHRHEEVCLGGPGSLLITEKSHLLNKRNNHNHHASCNDSTSASPMLSNDSCDVVLQTTATLGRSKKPLHHNKSLLVQLILTILFSLFYKHNFLSTVVCPVVGFISPKWFFFSLFTESQHYQPDSWRDLLNFNFFFRGPL